MTPTKLTTLLTELLQHQETMREWVNSLPSDLQLAFCDNAYANASACKFDVMCRAMFPDAALHEEIRWFLDEWVDAAPYNTITINLAGRSQMHLIHTASDFVHYLVAAGYIPNDTTEAPREVTL